VAVSLLFKSSFECTGGLVYLHFAFSFGTLMSVIKKFQYPVLKGFIGAESL